MQPGNLSCDSVEDVIWVPPSCQHKHGSTRRRNKLGFFTASDFTKRPHLRATDEHYGSHKLSSFRCSNLPGKATGTVRVQTDIHTRARRKSKWTTGGYGALRRCGCSRSGKGTQFHCLKFCLGSAGEPTICSHCYDVLNEEIAKNSNFKILQETLHAAHLVKLLDKMYKHEMDLTRTVGATDQTRDAGRTDGVKPTLLCRGYNYVSKSPVQHVCLYCYSVCPVGVNWMPGKL